jgi:hypothetical protein
MFGVRRGHYRHIDFLRRRLRFVIDALGGATGAKHRRAVPPRTTAIWVCVEPASGSVTTCRVAASQADLTSRVAPAESERQAVARTRLRGFRQQLFAEIG